MKANYEAAGFAAGEDVRLVPFIDDMAAAYAAADLVICRSGAMTVSEIAAVGVAALFVPFPYAVDDHQTSNAAFLADAGAAVLVQQRDLSAELLADWLRGQSRASLADMAERSRSLAKPRPPTKSRACAQRRPARTWNHLNETTPTLTSFAALRGGQPPGAARRRLT